MSKVEKKDKPKRINSYNIALREWNAERKKRNLKWLSPKKGTHTRIPRSSSIKETD
jgi:hypothetical protein